VRKSVVKILDKTKTPITITKEDIEEYLGPAIFKDERNLAGTGVITGLAWTAMGGATLSIEATIAHGFNRGFKLTGQLGDVMRESAEIAYSYILGHAGEFGADSDFFKEAFVHLHVPAGATPKDGPSAGITMASALLSLALNRKPVRNIAMTGELTLTGQVFPVGGIREKVIAARRAGIRELILPADNRGDYEEIPEHIRKGFKVHFAEQFRDVAAILFPKRKK
jgi:ATP-dependent Lon protease